MNLTGSFNLTRLVLEHLVQVQPEAGPDGERGVVVFVASAAAVSFSIYLSHRPVNRVAVRSLKGSPGRPPTPPQKVPCGP